MATGSPDYFPAFITSGTADEQKKQECTETVAEVSFTQTVRAFLIYNDGPNPIYYKRGTGATTDSFKIPSKVAHSLDVPTTTLSLICASGETATVYIIGVW